MHKSNSGMKLLGSLVLLPCQSGRRGETNERERRALRFDREGRCSQGNTNVLEF